MFTKKFGKVAYVGDTVEFSKGNYRIVAKVENDGDYNIDDDDSHNPDQSVTGCDDEEQIKLLAAREAWNRDEWGYCGIVLSLWLGKIEVNDHIASLWGIELGYPGSDNAYLNEVSETLARENADLISSEIEKFRQLAAG